MREPGRPGNLEPEPARQFRFHRSRIARRILLLFFFSALLPLVLFAGLSLHEVTQQLEEQAGERLHEGCKSIGMAMVERMHHLRTDLALVYEEAQVWPLETLTEDRGLSERLDVRFEWLALVGPNGVLLDSTARDLEPPRLSDLELAHLVENDTAVLFRPDPRTDEAATVMVLSDPTPEGREPLLFGRVRSEYLWGGEWTKHSGMDVVVLTADGNDAILETRAESGLREAIRDAASAEPSVGRFDWTGGGSSIVSYRTMFTRPQFFSSFLLALSQPRSYVLAPVATFKTLFVLFSILTLLTILVASVVEIRRSLQPIVILTEGTRRISEGRSDFRVEIESGDEFQELADAFNQMSARIQRRTGELERANRAKSSFLANMSHELRTPLTSVIGYAELSLDPSAVAEERLANLNVIRDSGLHLLEVVNTILDVSRVESGETVVDLAPCRPAEILDGVLRMMQPLANEKGLELVLERDERMPENIWSDAVRLRQVLVNVLGNAIKYTEEGHVRVHASWEEDESPSGHVLAVRVWDTGLGIPADLIEHIFEPFQRIDESMARRHGGTGLGLALARSVARELGGDLVCESTLGTGSVFTITVDPGLLKAIPGPLGTAPTAGAGLPTQLPACRVLLAEDVALNRKIVATMLRKAGCTVEEAENGREALEAALAATDGDGPFDLILMDMQMPEMDGYEATRRLRETDDTTPIVALTAHSFEGERERCLEAGCNGFETKPIEKERLLRVVHTWVGETARA